MRRVTRVGSAVAGRCSRGGDSGRRLVRVCGRGEFGGGGCEGRRGGGRVLGGWGGDGGRLGAAVATERRERGDGGGGLP